MLPRLGKTRKSRAGHRKMREPDLSEFLTLGSSRTRSVFCNYQMSRLGVSILLSNVPLSSDGTVVAQMCASPVWVENLEISSICLVSMIQFDAPHKAVHYPDDRRFRIWVRPAILIGIAVAILCVVAAAWIQFAVVGLPDIPAVAQVAPNNFSGPHGFPLWVRYCHFLNFFFVMLLIRSGLSILMDHPRLYFND